MLSKTFDKYGLFWVCTNRENNMELQSHYYFLSPVFSLAQQMSIEKKNMFPMLLKLRGFFLHKHFLEKLFLRNVSDQKPCLELPW